MRHAKPQYQSEAALQKKAPRGEPDRAPAVRLGYASPTHVYAVIAGLRWDTVGDARGSGPRWHPADAYPSGFVARHLPGL